MSVFKHFMSRFQPHVIAGVITLAGVLAFLGKSTQFLQFMDNISFETIDLRFNSRGTIPPGGHVVIAAIDDKSLNQEGKWPWPRSKITGLVTKASQTGALR